MEGAGWWSERKKRLLAVSPAPVVPDHDKIKAHLDQRLAHMREAMATMMSALGYLGTGVVIGAYAPQIWHL